MRSSFSTAGLYPIETQESFRLIQEGGFEEAELMPQCFYECTAGFAMKARKTIRVSSIHFPLVFFSVFYNAYSGMQKEARELSNHLLQSAYIFGSEIIVIHASNKTVPGEEDKFGLKVKENIRYLCDRAGEIGITIALENNPKTVADTPENLNLAIQELDHPYLKPMVDTTESTETCIDPAYFIEQVKPIHLHISDHKGSTKHIYPGEGDQNWESCFLAVRNLNYQGICVVEPSYRFLSNSPATDIKKAREFLQNYRM